MKRDAFVLPPGIYLDGNSLGPLTHAAQAATERRMKQWQHYGVDAWREWFGMAERLAPSVARLVGAHPDEVSVTGTITTNLHALLATFYRPGGTRRQLLATELDFPSDLYALRAWADREGGELRLVASDDGHTLDPDAIDAALTDEVAVAVLPTVLYRSGQRLDPQRHSAVARARGVTIGWDAAHSVGAMPHALHDAGADFAVWCSYKYLNAGPGAPGGLFVHRRHHERTPGLPGWWGHDKATQFEMAPGFRKASGAGAYQISTPPILALAGLEGALAVYEEVTIEAVRERSLELTRRLIEGVDARLPELTVVTPRRDEVRGGHVALAHPEARQLSAALRRRRIVTDFRPPDLVRLAPVALYTTDAEVDAALAALRELLDSGEHRSLEESTWVT